MIAYYYSIQSLKVVDSKRNAEHTMLLSSLVIHGLLQFILHRSALDNICNLQLVQIAATWLVPDSAWLAPGTLILYKFRALGPGHFQDHLLQVDPACLVRSSKKSLSWTLNSWITCYQVAHGWTISGADPSFRIAYTQRSR